MAVLGVQLVVTMVTASFLSKVSPKMSISRWIICNFLVRYLHPSDEELRSLAGVPKIPASKKGKKPQEATQKTKPDSFTIPKSTSIQLESAPITSLDAVQLKFYTEYQWLIDFSLCALFIYGLTELYYAMLTPKEEFNLSMMWCLVVLGFALKVLYSVTAIYFRTQESGERILCILFGIFFLVFAMGILVVDENTLEFGLEQAYFNFSQEARKFLDTQGLDSAGPMSLLTFRIVLAISCAVVGAFMTFPGLRLAKMHTDAIKYAAGSPFKQLLLYTNMIFPLFICLMWVKPVMRHYLVRRDHRGARKIMSDETFDTLRIMIILLFCLFRFSLIWSHLQSHLNTAVDKMNALRKEAGRISVKELQHMVTSVFYYLCVVALQYVAPLVLLAYSALMLKTLGEFSFASVFGLTLPSLNTNATTQPKVQETVINNDSEEQNIARTAAQFSVALSSLRRVFTPLCFRGIFSFLCWWITTTWFTTSAFGLLYYGYFTD